MRITRLDLLRYGKFTDKSIDLPSAAKDFHLIVGPNEAGKSTLRNAIQDLLFTIETRSRYNFIHPHSEMRLGALIEHSGDNLDFVRTKSKTKTLQTSTGEPLPDNTLLPYLGGVDRTFFDQMFGLNHERLVNGGQEILSASNDIGQILFQAAAGIGRLGEIRDELEAEATKLWSKRKSVDREYYIASYELDQAEAALKLVTVRTKDWQEARNQVDNITEELNLARVSYQQLEQERIQMERIRRVAPMLSNIIEQERQLNALSEVALLSEDAAEQLASAEHDIAITNQSLKLFEDRAAELQKQIQALNPDVSILSRSSDIQSLSEMRQQLRNHESDIVKREEEIRILWQNVEEAVRQLGWHVADEHAVAQRLPGSLIRSAIDNLIRRHEAIRQSVLAAEDSYSSREAEVKVINAEIEALPETQIPLTLIDALAKARSLGDIATQENRFNTQISRLNRELESTTVELGNWNSSVDGLRKLVLPTQDETNALIKRRGDLEAIATTQNGSIAELKSEIQTLELEITQYKSAHHPVTLSDVQQVRTSRDSTWQAIKTGIVALKDAAPGYEKVVAASDSISDKRHDKAKEETELQSRLDRLERLQQQLANYETRLQQNAHALSILDQDWDGRIKSIGLNSMPLLQINDWRAVKERVLSAADTLSEAEASQQEFIQGVSLIKSTLADALLAIKDDAKGLNLSALILLADEIVNLSTRAQERRTILTTQKIRAEAAIPELRNKVTQAQSAITQWQTELQKNLAIAHLPQESSIGAIEGALVLFERIDQQLQKIRDIRYNRVDMMRRDLKNFADVAKSLAGAIAPAIEEDPAPQIALSLANILSSELAASQDLTRLKAEFEKVTEQANAAKSKIAEAKAGLEPLLLLSKSSDYDNLRAAIQSSDRLRSLTIEIAQVGNQLLQSGDGLRRDSLEAEFNGVDISTTTIRLSEIKRQLDEVVSQQNRLSGELIAAEAILGKIAGQDEAAQAESLRQEALARMSNAAERYIKVYTAAKLLRWSIERFRESKQGPMLSRAGDVFSGLTQREFKRLVVDYESNPLKLSGQRITGELVDIEGMSEGTRDQLYLALRLAALELHLEQTIPLPFIADDLFINFDDGRAKAGFKALAMLSEKTQVLFLTHHEHLVPVAQSVFGENLNIVNMNELL